ncbi:unnamed protein product [Acanthoscelides obtectus]|uniref:Uncharacterized protein n=1 Tax=Acanthoscelides obtectus TaxID=200917 RepID=A0A9P0VVX4_ACAOB|nr:unnamed protein product [Acanthoscelides obtectus]
MLADVADIESDEETEGEDAEEAPSSESESEGDWRLKISITTLLLLTNHSRLTFQKQFGLTISYGISMIHPQIQGIPVLNHGWIVMHFSFKELCLRFYL